MINLAPNCNSQSPPHALPCSSYEKLGEQCFRGLCRQPGPAGGTDGAGAARALVPGHAAGGTELRLALVKRGLPPDFEAKLSRLGEGNLIQRYVEQNSRLFFALLLAASESSFIRATPSDRERLLRVLAYVRKDDDAIPDYLPSGFMDDQQEVRAAAMELGPLLHAFKAWRQCHLVPAMWRSAALI